MPPRTQTSSLFTAPPTGEIIKYTDRIPASEWKNIETNTEEMLACLRMAAETHRQNRQYARENIKPGMRMMDICEMIESTTKALVGENQFGSGIAFPTGCSLNNCAAHYTPNPGDDKTLSAEDICKIDIGIHVNGYIIDSAFTIAFDPCYDPVIDATKDATNTALQMAGVDVSLGDIGAVIEEVITSYEMIKDGKTLPIKPIRNLSGHTIGRYTIHSGKTVPLIKTSGLGRMEEGELYAIETFASTGKGRIAEDIGTSHYSRKKTSYMPALRTAQEKALLENIDKWFGTLPFCKRYLAERGAEKHAVQLSSLVQKNIVEKYPPLCDIKGSYTAQTEHTVYIGESSKEVLSRGEDY